MYNTKSVHCTSGKLLGSLVQSSGAITYGSTVNPDLKTLFSYLPLASDDNSVTYSEGLAKHGTFPEAVS